MDKQLTDKSDIRLDSPDVARGTWLFKSLIILLRTLQCFPGGEEEVAEGLEGEEIFSIQDLEDLKEILMEAWWGLEDMEDLVKEWARVKECLEAQGLATEVVEVQGSTETILVKM